MDRVGFEPTTSAAMPILYGIHNIEEKEILKERNLDDGSTRKSG
jgi:hypothetical protein